MAGSTQTFTGSEQFFHCTEGYDSPYKTLNLSRYLSAGTNPGVVFTHHALSTWHYTPLPPAEVATALAQAVAGGSNTWFAIFWETIKADAAPALSALETTGKFIVESEPFIMADHSAADTAVLISNHTLFYYLTRHRALCRDIDTGREAGLVVDAGGAQKAGDANARRAASAEILEHETQGCFDACNFGHVPLRVLWDEPATRKDWLRFLGIDRVEGVFVPSRTEDYLTPKTPITGFAVGSMIPRPSNALAIRPTRDAQSLALYLNPINKSYTQPKGVSDYPAILLRPHGKGRVVYMASPVFESFDRFHIDAHKELAREMIRLAAGSAGLQVETNAPGSLAIEVREQPGRTLVHLVNVTSDMKRPMGAIIPLHDVTVAVRAGKAARARCLRSGKTLRLERTDGRVRFHVPLIHDHEIVLRSDA